MAWGPIPFRFLLVTDRRLCGQRSLVEVVEQALAGGVDGVQLREKDLPAGPLYDLSREVLKATTAHGAPLLINDRADVALAAHAQGVHLTSQSLPIGPLRSAVGPDFLLGRSVHNLDEALEAEREGADYIVFGPIFPTASKAQYGPPQGVGRLREVVAALSIPVVAIGGIHRGTAGALAGSGAAAVAVISAVMSARDPRRAASELREIAGKILA